MADRIKTVAAAAIAGLAVAMVAAALFVTGGPFYARKENRDQIRRTDLNAIGWHAQCMARIEKTGPPATLTATPGCGQTPRMTDPFTNTDYGYEVLDTTTLRLCAAFELPLASLPTSFGDGVSLQPGCLDFHIPLASDDNEAS